MTYYKIPLTAEPNQRLQFTMMFGGVNKTLTLVIFYNNVAACWTMDVIDTATDAYLIMNITLLTGTDLLGQYQYKNIGHAMVYKKSDIPKDIPDTTDLGSDFLLVWAGD